MTNSFTDHRPAVSRISAADASRSTSSLPLPGRPAPFPASRPDDPTQTERSRHAGEQTDYLPDLLAGSVPDGRLIALAMLAGVVAVILVIGAL
jgi:hypothetical protein